MRDEIYILKNVCPLLVIPVFEDAEQL